MEPNKNILYIGRGGYVDEALISAFAEVCARKNWTLRTEPTVGEKTQALPVPEDLFKEADLVVLGRTRKDKNGIAWPNTPGIDKYAEKVVALDTSDGPQRKVVHDCAYYLKREHTGNKWQRRLGAIPFSMCPPRDVVAMHPLPWEQRGIDVFVAVSTKLNETRKKIVRDIRHASGFSAFVHEYDSKGGAIPRSAYLDLLRRSKIAISPRGSGQDTNTYWEVPACGVVLLAERRTITITDNFEEGEEAIFFETPNEMLEQCAVALQDKGRLREMALAGRAKVLKYHTAEKRVQTLLEIAKPILDRS